MVTLHKIDLHRRLCIKKDLNELCSLHNVLEAFNTELDHLSVIEKQLLKNVSVSSAILAMRRKNVMLMACFCKYKQELNTELEYSKTEYDLNRLKVHEQKRESYILLIEDFSAFKNQYYTLLKKFKRD
ncbi:hypothetical protein [Lacinutrix sp. Bg11-31]|uniref:hypothetical protein n=1 Tax=Lacinutrix sp. Bg11-31 TaxID=2057808 RepID=UPI000C309ED1|nr:hypothetical protein [Lacinutrix sp. Bg11-31]AUC81773.1 hypothetical protein CW733_06380 [Lacinutrix sp. Bg11-31]